LPVSRLGCYGLAESDEADRSWLFIEDARGEKFDAGKDEHRRLAARWFADVHRTSAEIDLRELPSRGVSHYYGVLENTLDALEAAASNRHLDSSDAAVARRAIRACESISRHWNDVAGICQLLPNTLVHGGIGRKNVQVRHNKGCLEFLPFDWEAAGRGMAAMDLSRVDSVVYAKALGKNARRVQDITAVGRALWSISSIPGEAANLASPWASRTMPKVQAYADELEAVMKRFGWVGS
jgi:hypothetical protein